MWVETASGCSARRPREGVFVPDGLVSTILFHA